MHITVPTSILLKLKNRICIALYWVMVLCSLSGRGYQHFRGIYCLHFSSDVLLSPILFVPLNEFTQEKRMSSNTEPQEAIIYFLHILFYFFVLEKLLHLG